MTTPYEPEFWPYAMTRDGDTATAEQMAAAWTRCLRSSAAPLSYSGLAALLQFQGATVGSKSHHCARLADAMLQRARKAGHIRHENGRWVVLTEDRSHG